MMVFWRLFIVFGLFLYSEVFQKLDLFWFWHGGCRNCLCKRSHQISRLIFRCYIPVLRTALFWTIRQRVLVISYRGPGPNIPKTPSCTTKFTNLQVTHFGFSIMPSSDLFIYVFFYMAIGVEQVWWWLNCKAKLVPWRYVSFIVHDGVLECI
jgi:hypothetical protein